MRARGAQPIARMAIAVDSAQMRDVCAGTAVANRQPECCSWIRNGFVPPRR
jgi:hypothetical protein